MVIAGVDEAGRGALAGPVVVAAAVLPVGFPEDRLCDSKQIPEHIREEVYELLLYKGAVYALGVISHRYIDRINIFQATMRGMAQSIQRLSVSVNKVMVDGNKAPVVPGYDIETIVKGDALIPAISAASIIAKVTRDRIMRAIDRKFPEYGFAQHKGYGTQRHVDAIFRFGRCDVHRQTFSVTKQNSLF